MMSMALAVVAIIGASTTSYESIEARQEWDAERAELLQRIHHLEQQRSPPTSMRKPLFAHLPGPGPCSSDSKLRSSEPLGIAAVSHVNVVVDNVTSAAAYYQSVLGFEEAYNADGKMEYPDISLTSFCLNAGFDDGVCRLDILFMKHPTLGLYLELFKYKLPPSDKVGPFETTDAGGVRHIALEVEDANHTYFTLKAMDHGGTFVTELAGGPLELVPFPYWFFYWRDRYHVQWEFEQGRPVEYYHIAGITG